MVEIEFSVINHGFFYIYILAAYTVAAAENSAYISMM